MPAETPWQGILRFIESREAGFSATIRGATEAEIRALCSTAPHPVPTAVVELFASMGHTTGRYDPVGGNVSTDIGPMLEDLEYQCLGERAFRVAIDPDLDQLGPSNVYIDLLQSDGYDAPLVSLGEAWHGGVPDLRDHTLISKATQRAFWTFELSRWGVRGYVSEPVELSSVDDYARAFTELAQRMSLSPVFNQSTKVLCHVGDNAALMFDLLGAGTSSGVHAYTPPRTHEFLRVWLAVDTLDAFHLLSEQVRSHMPPLAPARVLLPDKVVELKELLRAREP